MTPAPWAKVRIRSVLPNPESTGHWDRWAVDCEVLGDRGESWPDNVERLRLLVHSPTKTFAVAVDDLPRRRFRIELEAPVEEIYRGAVRVLPKEVR